MSSGSQRSDGSLETLGALHEVAVATGLGDSVRAARLAVENACRLLRLDGAAIFTWDEESKTLRATAESGGSSREPAFQAGEGEVGAAFQGVVSLVVEDYPRWEGAADGSRSRGMVSCVALPLLANGRAVGAMRAWTRRRRHFTAPELELLSLFAAQVAPAVEADSLAARLPASQKRSPSHDETISWFRAVFDHSGIGIVRVGLEGTVAEANPAFHRLIRGRPEEITGINFSELLEQGDEDAARLFDLGQAGEQHQIEIRYRRRDGMLVWGSSLACLVRDESDRPLFLAVLVEDVNQRKAQEAALAHQALHDALTDLPNRTLLQDRLRQALLTAQRESGSVALLVLDLDGFKEVNDTFGHPLGDILLQQVAARLRTQLRESDTVARLGGDEFAIILPGVGEEGAAGLAARKIVKSLEEPFLVNRELLHLGGSLGIATFPRHGRDGDTLMRRADIAMYLAKRSRAGFAIYNSEEETGGADRLALLGQLRQAIQEDGLVLHYQPKVELRTGRTVSLEALVRWPHPEQGLILPDRFVPLAEDTGLTNALAVWVIEAAVRQCAAWEREGIRLPVAVNVSTRSLLDAQLPETIQWLLSTHAVPPSRLRVEVTESTLMASPEHAMEVLSALAEMDLGITLDDFGTGYSSLAYLGRLPADELKIARPFVIEMATVDSARVIVRSIIDLGHSLGLTVVAEGVESQHTLDMLATTGCDMAQGFHLSPALPAEQVPAFLASRAEPVEGL